MSDEPVQAGPSQDHAQSAPREEAPARGWRHRLHEIIFEADTQLGRAFDIGLLIAILASIVAVMLESVGPIRAEHARTLRALEWGFTILFTIEYVLRLVSVRRPLGYATSFFGVVDLLTIVPTYLTLLPLGEGAQTLIVIRALRLLRIFRIFKAARYLGEAGVLMAALRASRAKITVFLVGVLTLVLIIAAVMYLVEGGGGNTQFSSIPESMYWTIVTLTTVGYGDLTPQTTLGKALAAAVMIIGYAIIAIPTGIVTAELTFESRRRARAVAPTTQVCPVCMAEDHVPGANYCHRCGSHL